jgi:hypothetical protein
MRGLVVKYATLICVMPCVLAIYQCFRGCVDVVNICNHAGKKQLDGRIYFEKHGGIFRWTGAHVLIRQYKLPVEQRPRELETRYSKAM